MLVMGIGKAVKLARGDGWGVVSYIGDYFRNVDYPWDSDDAWTSARHAKTKGAAKQALYRLARRFRTRVEMRDAGLWHPDQGDLTQAVERRLKKQYKANR